MTDPIDKHLVRRAFGRAAADYDRAAVLQREVGARMLERLDVVRLQPKLVLDAGAGTGAQAELLLRRYRDARVLALDFALPMLQRARRRGGWRRRPGCLCGDLEQLPLVDACVDLVYSNLALQWVNGLDQVFAECLRVLRPGGLFMFTSFGPDTLKELRAAWAGVDSGYAHVSPFLDMHDVGDALMRARFADPVMDVEHLVLTYAEVDGLMRDLKSIGAANANRARFRAMTGKRRMGAMRAAYEDFRGPDGRLPATFEVVYGHAWAPAQRRSAGETRVPVEALRKRRPGEA
ncbi:MAG: malonyl-ACP O-methyltransferase BioC [Gammaproteobacteria bacterium]|jgi:malonyl-CoA O-methyltransferase